MDIDGVYREIGEFGAFQQKIFWGFASFQGLVLAMHQVQNVFVGAEPKFYCKRGKESFVGCPSDGKSCDSYVFTGEDFTSIKSQWSLVCDQSYKADLAQSCVMLGILFGSLIFGYLGDKYGRRKMMYTNALGVAVATSLGIVVPNYYFYLFTRVLDGMFCAGSGMIGFVLVTECIGQSKRGFSGMVMPLAFALGIVLYSGMAYCIREWKLLAASTVIAPTFYAVFFYLVFPESPRWLYSQGRVDEAERALEMFAYKNNGQMPKKTISLSRDSTTKSSATPTVPGIGQILRHPILRSLTLNNSYTWFVNCAVYYGLTLSAGNLGFNLYVSVALSGLVEVPSYFIAFLLMEKVGRRFTYSLSMLLGGVFCLVLMMIPSSMGTTRVVLATLGKMGISVSFCVAWLYAAEMYPTNIRNKALSLCNMMARFGGIASPMIVSLGAVHANMDFIIFGVITFIAGIVCLKLPETRGKSMPETIDDLDKAASRRSSGVISEKNINPMISEDKLKLLQDEIEYNSTGDLI